MAEKKKKVLRGPGGQIMKGSGGLPNSGLKTGQKLRKINVIIAELEGKLQRNCDPVVTLLELASGHDALVEQELAHIDPERVQEVLDTPGWQFMSQDDAKKLGISTEALRLLKDRHIPRDTRVDAAKAASRFVRPILAQTEVSGPDRGAIPVAAAMFPVSSLMRDEEAVALIERMQISLAGQIRNASSIDEEEKENE
jgi:hypothetical protein